MRILYALILQLNPPIGSPSVITSEEKVKKQIAIAFFYLLLLLVFVVLLLSFCLFSGLFPEAEIAERNVMKENSTHFFFLFRKEPDPVFEP